MGARRGLTGMAARRRRGSSTTGDRTGRRSSAAIRVKWPWLIVFLICVGLLAWGGYATQDDQAAPTPFPSNAE